MQIQRQPHQDTLEASPFELGKLHAIFQLRGECPSASFSRAIRNGQLLDAQSFVSGYTLEMDDFVDVMG